MAAFAPNSSRCPKLLPWKVHRDVNIARAFGMVVVQPAAAPVLVSWKSQVIFVRVYDFDRRRLLSVVLS